MNPTRIFALTYLGTLFGEAQAIDINGYAVFYHDSCDLDVAVFYGDTMEINANLPTSIYHQLVGYCAINNIVWEEV